MKTIRINTTESVGQELNISPARVRQLVRELGLEPMMVGKAIVLSDADVRKMKGRKRSMGPVKGNGKRKKGKTNEGK